MRRSLIPMLVLAGALLAFAGGCMKAPPPPWPAITEPPTNIHTPGRWVWAELFADNVDAAKTFYQEVFGWKFESSGAGKDAYTLVRDDGRPIAGIVHFAKPADAVRSARWLALMSVPDVARTAEQATASGGKVIVAPRTIPGRGEVAVLADPDGALFGVIRSAAGDPPDTFPAFNAWLWFELWSKDASRMADFYRPIGAYTISRQEGPGDLTELHLVAGGYPRAGILELKRKDLPTAWLPYVRVKDLKQTLAGVTRAGGRIVVEPAPEIRNGKVAVFVDPQGAPIAAVEWQDEDGGEGRP
jgi:predicted enzyme related to lactoylglutathione lyase